MLLWGACGRRTAVADLGRVLQRVIAEHSLNDIYRWAYKPGVNFYFEVKPEDEEDENPLYMFGTSEGKHIADLLTDYAMGLLREMGLNADGTRVDGDGDEAKGDGDEDDAGAGTGDDEEGVRCWAGHWACTWLARCWRLRLRVAVVFCGTCVLC